MTGPEGLGRLIEFVAAGWVIVGLIIWRMERVEAANRRREGRK